MRYIKQVLVVLLAFLLAFTSFDVPPVEAFTRVSNTDVMPKNRLVLFKNPNITNFNVTVSAGSPNRGSFNSREKYGSFQQEYGYRTLQITKPSQNVDFYSSDRVVANWGNVGTYDGRPIDMRATFRDMKYESMFPTPSASGVNAGMSLNTMYLQISESPYSGFAYFNVSSISVTYQFFDRATGELINTPGAYMTASSLNGFGTYQDGTPRTITGRDWETGLIREVADPGLGEFVNYDRESTVHVRNDTNIARRSHSGLPYTSPVYIGISNQFEDRLGSDTFTKNSASFLLTGSSHTFTFGSGKRNSAWAALSTGVLFRPSAETPTKQVTSTSGANLAGQDIMVGTRFKYRISQKVHIIGQEIIDPYTSFTIRDDLPYGTKYYNARLIDETTGLAVVNPGTINESGGLVTFAASRDFLDNRMVYDGRTYTLEITVDAASVPSRTTATNQATTNLGGDPKATNTVTNVIVPYGSPPPPPVTPPDPEQYRVTAYHVHAKSGTTIMTEGGNYDDGDTYSFSSRSNLVNGEGYKYIPLAPMTRSGTVNGSDVAVYLYYDLPLVDLGLKEARIYTDDEASGLPFRVEFDPKWIDASSPSQLSGYTATIRVRNTANGATYNVTHPLTSMVYNGRIPAATLSGALRDRYEISFTVSNTDYIVRRPGDILLHGYRASKQTVDVTANNLSYTGVVMVQNTVGGSEQAFNETLTATTPTLPRLKTGYGFPLEMTYTYTNNLTTATEIAGLNTIPAVPQPVNALVDPSLIDSHVKFKNALAPATDHPKGTVSLIGTGNRTGRLYTETYTLPELLIESNTGNLFTLEQRAAGDSRIKYALKAAGKKLYVPIWADVNKYDYRFESVGTPRGANKVRFVLRRDMDVHAHMFSHIDSGTPDDDELLLTPLSLEEAERASDPWYRDY